MINQSTISVSDCYKLHITVSKAHRCSVLAIDSQFTGAKDPNGLQRMITLSLEPSVMSELADAIYNLVSGDGNANHE